MLKMSVKKNEASSPREGTASAVRDASRSGVPERATSPERPKSPGGAGAGKNPTRAGARAGPRAAGGAPPRRGGGDSPPPRARPKRRVFTAEYKLRIVREADEALAS